MGTLAPMKEISNSSIGGSHSTVAHYNYTYSVGTLNDMLAAQTTQRSIQRAIAMHMYQNLVSINMLTSYLTTSMIIQRSTHVRKFVIKYIYIYGTRQGLISHFFLDFEFENHQGISTLKFCQTTEKNRLNSLKLVGFDKIPLTAFHDRKVKLRQSQV